MVRRGEDVHDAVVRGILPPFEDRGDIIRERNSDSERDRIFDSYAYINPSRLAGGRVWGGSPRV